MTSWQRWLNTQGPVVKDTSSPLAGRWASTQAVSAITKTNGYIVIPQFDFPVDGIGNATFHGDTQVGQFNYTSSAPFSLVGSFAGLETKNADFFFCIRYRIGTVSYRYILPTEAVLGYTSSLNRPFYTGQVIMPQFSIEVYCLSGAVPDQDITTPNDLSVKTSLLQTPNSLPQQDFPINPQNTVSNFFVSSTQILPFNWPDQNSIWQSN